MKSSKRQRLISFLCVFLVTIISVGSITAMASSKYGIATIKANSATSTIGDVKKEFPSDKASGIIAQRSSGQKTNYFCYIWVKDTTKSKVLSDKKLILVHQVIPHTISITNLVYQQAKGIRFGSTDHKPLHKQRACPTPSPATKSHKHRATVQWAAAARLPSERTDAMKKCLRCQMRLLVRSPGFWVAMAFGVLYAVGYFVAMCLRNMHLDAIAQPTPYSAYSTHGLSFTTPYFMYLFPILACISFSDSSLYERNNHLLAPLLGKMGIGRYYRSKLVAVFCGGFLPIFATQALNMGLCLIAFPLNGTQRYGWDLFQDYTYWYHVSDPHFFFQHLYLYSPYLYYLLYMLLSALVAGLFAVAAWQFSFFVRNRIFTYTIMFLVIQGIEYLLILTPDWPLNILSYLYGMNPTVPTPGGFAICMAFYLALAFLPALIVPKKLRNCL